MSKNKKTNDTSLIVTTVGSLVPDPSQVVVSDTPAPQKINNSLVGKEISINLKKETYFGLGNIWLTPDAYWCTIPDNMTPEQYNIIDKSLQAGTIVLGKVFIPPIDKASNTLEKYWLMIKESGLESKKAKSEFAMLIKRGSDSGWTALEIVNYCIEKETKGRKRKDVLRLLEQVAKNYDGPVRLYDPPDEAEGVKKVTINPDGSVKVTTNSGAEVAKPMAEPLPPKDFVKGSKTASQAVNEIFS